jgi:hypothetical protein
MPDMGDEEFLDYGDDYDDEEYGSQSQGAGQYYYDGRDAADARMLGMHGIEASGGSGEYEDEEDISDESGILRQ